MKKKPSATEEYIQKLREHAPKFRKDFLHPRHWGTWGLIILSFIVSWLPYFVMVWISKLIAIIFKTSNIHFIRRRRLIARRNLELCFPHKGPEWQEEIFNKYCSNVGYALFDVVIAWWWPKWRFYRLVKINKELFSPYYHKDHYLFFVAHFMNLESCARAIGESQNSFAVYLANADEFWEWFQYRMRLKDNKALIRKDRFRDMVSALKRKEGLFYSMDQNLGGSALYVPFFGKEDAWTTRGTYMLFKLFKDMKLIPLVLLKSTDPKYKFELKALEPLSFEPDASEEEVLLKTNQLLERMIELDMTNYMWLHRRFKHSKDGTDYYADIDQDH